jgi:hypothetical protein
MAVALLLLVQNVARADTVTFPLPIGLSMTDIKAGYVATSLNFSFPEDLQKIPLEETPSPPLTTPEGAALELARILFEGDRARYGPYRHPRIRLRDHFGEHQMFYFEARKHLEDDYSLYSISQFPHFCGAALKCEGVDCTGDVDAGWEYPLILEEEDGNWYDARGLIIEDIVAQHYVALLRARSTNPAFSLGVEPNEFSVAIPEGGLTIRFDGDVPEWGADVFRHGEFVVAAIPDDASAQPYFQALKFFRETWLTFSAIPSENYIESPEMKAFLSRMLQSHRAQFLEWVGSGSTFTDYRTGTVQGGLIIRFILEADPFYIFFCTSAASNFEEFAAPMLRREGDLYQLVGIPSPCMTQSLFLDARISPHMVSFLKGLQQE